MDVEPRGIVGPQTLADGAQRAFRQGRGGEQIVAELGGRYQELVSRGEVFAARAVVTAPVIFTTAAGTGGPLLWNGSNDKVAVLLGATVGLTVVTTVAAALGITGGSGQTTAPGSTTAIDSHFNCRIGGGLGSVNAYRVGTPTAAGSFFLPFAQLHTGALTVDNLGLGFIDLGGMIQVPPQCWASISASATATTTVAQLGLIWAEIPV